MVKTPRSVRGPRLASALVRLGYQPIHQAGSHAKYATTEAGRHIVIIPMHRSAIPVGTLSRILKDVADHFDLSAEELISRLGL